MLTWSQGFLSLSLSKRQEAIFRTLAAILHLGNIEFSPGEEHDSSIIKDEKANFHLGMAADLFMLVLFICIIINLYIPCE